MSRYTINAMIVLNTRLILVCALTAWLTACSEAPAPAEAPPAREAPAVPVEPRPEGLVQPGAEWALLTRGYVYTDSPVALSGDDVVFAAPIQNMVYRLDAADNVTPFDTATEHTMGLVMGKDGLIYGCRNRGAQIVRYTPDGNRETLLQGEMTPLPDNPNAPGEFCNDVAVADNGNIWFTDRVNRSILLLRPDGTVMKVAGGFRGNGIVLSADGETLAVTDSVEARLWAFAVSEDGTLTERENFFGPVQTVTRLGDEVIQEGRPGTNGMTVDRDGRFYVSSFYGIQVYAPDGAYIGVIDKPKGFVSNLTFAGAGRDQLYVTGTNGVWRLPMQVTGTR
ncbi:MAG: SMP-30/gluconolactonase/LRE family protein [Gammaproteobacteria bacterium]|nr:SMP-30/gluconolactonase/LRE family protein [Gammaproteobacteria bacterium]NND54640.1 SMP-30/gluconolactonase/LRE family protein [Gammaproteobacteria bacterium]